MSDLIARLEASIREVWGDRAAHEAVEPIRAALRQKEAEIAKLQAAWDASYLQAMENGYAAEEAEAQISALRDQQPVAWINRERGLATTDPTTKDRYPGTYDALVYAHPSCVSPEQEKK